MAQSMLKAQAIKEWYRCKTDPKYFIFNYCHTFDPRKSPSIFIMKPWPHLCNLVDELEAALKGSYSLIIEKSRDMGVSWTIMAWQLQKANFFEGFSSLNVSRKESEVEDSGKTPISLFGRLDFIYKRLPVFLKLRVDNPFLAFKVPSNNSYIKGESANVHAGRDFQYTFILLDEAGHIPILDEMWKSIVNSSNCVCLNSTPPREGRAHKFSQLRFQKESNFKILKYHWSQHPEKNALWFANKTLNMTEEDIARELDINYEKSMTFRIYPEFEEEIHVAQNILYYNPKKPLYLSFDFGLDDPESILFYQKTIDADGNARLLILDEYEKSNLLTSEHFINVEKKLIGIAYAGTIGELICYGDPAGSKRERTSRMSVIQEYANYGLKIKIKEATLEERRRSVKIIFKSRDSLGQPRILISPKCTNLIDSLKGHQRKKLENDDAKKDKTCHSVTSLEYFCVNEFPPLTASAIIYGKDPEIRKRGILSFQPKERRSLIW